MNYNFTNSDKSPITLTHYGKILKLIEEKFPGSLQGTIELEGTKSTTHDIEGTTFFMNYKNFGTNAIIPELTNEIKKKFENLTKLNLEKFN